MKLKRIISAFLAAALCVSLTVPVSAEDEDSADAKALKAALTEVKQRVDIPEDFSDFNYNVRIDNGARYYSLNWSDADGNGSLNVTYCRKVITNYSYYNNDDNMYNWNTVSFGKLTPEELVKAAKAFIKKINPTVGGAIVLRNEEINGSLRGNQTYMSFSRKKNGVPVDDGYGSLCINKDTGTVYNFDMNWTMGLTFDSPKNALTQSEAENAYVDSIGIEPVYEVTNSFDEQTQEYNKSARIVYIPVQTGYLDALTGERYEPVYSNYYYENGIGTPEDEAVADDADAAVTFTPEEQEKIDIDEMLLQTEDITKLLRDNEYIKLADDMELSSSYLNKDYYEDDLYKWNVNYNDKDNCYVYATVDANTGKIYGFNTYCYEDKSLAEFDEAKCDALADTIAESLVGADMFAEYKLGDTDVAIDYDTKKNVNKNYTYNRYVNGIKVSGDTISLGLMGEGVISSFYYNYSEVDFPSTDGMLSVADVKKILFDKYDLEMTYLVNSNEKNKSFSKLVYEIAGWSIDAMTGEFDYVDTFYEDDYSDIADSKYKDIIEKLADYGVSLPAIDGKFMENEAVTNGEFYNLMSALGNYYEPIMPLYEITVDGDGNEVANYDLPITVSDAATQMVCSIYNSDVPGLQGIYKSPFTNLSDDAPLIGYYAVAYATGIFKDINGENPTELDTEAFLTRGEAINWIYSYIVYSPKG